MKTKDESMFLRKTQSNGPNITDSKVQYRYVLWVVIVFFLTYYLFYTAEKPIHGFIASLTNLRSEYTVGEQLSKFYLFVIVLNSICAYTFFDESNRIKVSISFLVLGLVLYLSESNMLTEITQPIFGSIIILYCLNYLFRLRAWLTIAIFLLGFTLIFAGVLDDMAAEKEYISSRIPTLLLNQLNAISEERFDVGGIALICLSSILLFSRPLCDLAKRNKIRIALLLFLSAMITVGDGLMHYQYRPSNRLHFVASLITLIGLCGFIVVNKSNKSRNAVFKLVTEDIFYFFLVLFFVLLPSIHGQARSSVSILIWLPFMFLLAHYLWRYHPVNKQIG